MGFRDSFYSRGKTSGQLMLEQTLAEQLGDLKRSLENNLDRELTGACRKFTGEVRTIAGHIDGVAVAVDRGQKQLASAIKELSDYLGGELCELRWSMDQMVGVSHEILNVLLESLDNESRQYFEQGIQCYQVGELDMARERFLKAVETKRTNHFAYNFLGFISAAQDKSEEAMRFFELAGKFAPNSYSKACALMHMARCWHSLGKVAKAEETAATALGIDGTDASFWYDYALYAARANREEMAVKSLRTAILLDWTYFGIAPADSRFDAIADQLAKMLNKLREMERVKATAGLDAIREANEVLSAVGVVATEPHELSALESLHNDKTVFGYREVTERAGKMLAQASTRLQERANEEVGQIQQHDAHDVAAKSAFVVVSLGALALLIAFIVDERSLGYKLLILIPALIGAAIILVPLGAVVFGVSRLTLGPLLNHSSVRRRDQVAAHFRSLAEQLEVLQRPERTPKRPVTKPYHKGKKLPNGAAINCRQCGAKQEQDDDSLYCDQCGHSLSGKDEQER